MDSCSLIKWICEFTSEWVLRALALFQSDQPDFYVELYRYI